MVAWLIGRLPSYLNSFSIKLLHIGCEEYNSSMTDDRDPTPQELQEHERVQEEVARAAADEALTEEEARAELRRADKARYLQEKLEAQQQADRDAH